MSHVCPCPFCGQQTAIPDHLDPARIVRCPLCEYEFPLDDALFHATEAPPDHVAELPPELVPVDQAAQEGGASRDGGADDSAASPTAREPDAFQDRTDAESHETHVEPNVAPDAEVEAQACPSRPVTIAAPTPESIPEPPRQSDEPPPTGCAPPEPPLVVVEDVSVALEQAVLGGQAVEIQTGSVDVSLQETDTSAVPSQLPEIAAGLLPEVTEAAWEGSSGVIEETASMTVTEPAPDEAAADAGGTAWTPSVVDTADSDDAAAPPDISGAIDVGASNEAAGAGTMPQVESHVAADETAGHEASSERPFDFGLHEPGETGAAVGAWRERRQRNPILSFVGIVVSGALGLAVAYGLMSWLGPSKLQFWRAGRRPAVERDSLPAGKSVEPGAMQPKTSLDPEDPKSFTEFPDLDDKRFEESPKTNVQPTSKRAPKGPGGSKGP